jgi:hypothetical protein
VTRADEAASQSKVRRKARAPAFIGVVLVGLVNTLRLGWPTGLLVFVGGTAGVLFLIWLILRLSVARRRRHLPPGVLWKADAVVYGQELPPFTAARLSIGPGAQVVGWFEVTPHSVSWRPRPRFQKRGAPTISVTWPEVDEIATAPGSSGVGRRLASLDVFSVRLKDGRSFAAFVTNPQPVHDALASLGRPVVQLDPDRPTPSVEPD